MLSEAELLEEDLIETRVGVHDSNHFEVKLDYSIKSNEANRYLVETYLFIPSSLGINEHTYGSEQFFNDIQAYIRFKTPNIPLPKMARMDEPSSPLTQVRNLVTELCQSPRDLELRQKLSYELRIFGCITRSRVRDRTRAVREHLDRLQSPGNINDVRLQDVRRLWEALLDDIATIVKVWRDLRPSFIDGQLPQSARETYEYVDEYISLVLEVRLTGLVQRADSLPEGKAQLEEVRYRTRDILLAEREYRAGANYVAVVNERDGNNDHFIYRQGILKKFVMSVLWLEISKEKEGQRAANFGAAIAAGAAMFFAVVATIFATKWYGINSWSFVMAAVVTYILKDRIKDWLKSFMGSRMSRFLADYSVSIRDPVSNESIGRLRENFGYLKPSRVPAEVMSCRHKDSKISIEAMGKPEVIIRYAKEVRLLGKDIIQRLHLKDYDLNDILRFSVWRFQSRADDPKSTIPYYSTENDEVRHRRFRKVYHLNLVMALRSTNSGDRPILRRVRVIFDKNAIRELQEVP